MLLQFHSNAQPTQVNDVQEFLQRFDLIMKQVHAQGGIYLATSGDERTLPWAEIASMPGVSKVVQVPDPYYFTSRKFKEEPTIVKVGNVPVGGRHVVMIAGPCAVENREDTLATAAAVKALGADIFRGGAFKPRTTPYNFQGIGYKGLEILAEVRERYGLPVVTEVLDPYDIAAIAGHCDALQVGTRNMTNSALLKRLGSAGKPILLKRSFSAKIEELVRAAEFITVYGNPDVILCERGIQTFETYTRYTLDLSAIPALKEMSHLPVVVDPSHGTGRPSLIPSMAKAAVVSGADGLMIECHVAPENMIKPGDDFQALRPPELEQLLVELRPFYALLNRE